MSEVSITLPLSMFGEMSIDAVIANVKDVAESAAKVETAERLRDEMARQSVSWANNLQQILDGDWDEFTKLRALRELSTAVRNYSEHVKVSNQL